MGIPADQQIQIKIFPKSQKFLERLFDKGAKSSDDAESDILIGNNLVFNSNLQMITELFDEKGSLSMEKMVLY